MENSVAASGSFRDRISNLPQPLLHNILCFLSQKEAVQTCVLSKSWRYLGSTRPNLEFVFRNRGFYKQSFMPVVENTLHRYHEQKLCIQEFHVELDTNNSESASFLERWFPYLVATMGGGGLKSFDLSVGLANYPNYSDLHPEFFENSKSLRFLRLCGFSISPCLQMDRVHLKHLQTLILWDAHIEDETFQKIMSSCCFIERLDLFRCNGLTTIRLMNKNHLKRFYLCDFHFDHQYRKTEDLCLVGVPNLESLKLSTCGNYWFNIDRRRNMYFPGLKSLELSSLRLPTRPSLDILSRDFPCLQDIYIHDCSGFGELRVSSCSIKKMTLSSLYSPMKVVVDVPNLELLDYSCSSTLDFSFATTSDECVSKMEPCCDVRSEGGFLKLRKLLEAVSQSSSKIHLVIPHKGMYSDSSDYGYGTTGDEDDDNGGDGYGGCGDEDDYGDEEDDNGGGGYDYDDYYGDEDYNSDGGYETEDYYSDREDDNGDDNQDICADGDGGYNIKPVPVEYLLLDYEGHGYFYSKKFLNRMFRYCRPRNILERHCSPRSRTRFLCKKLLLKQNRGNPYYGQQDLEEATMELWDHNTEQWHYVDGTTFLESGAAGVVSGSPYDYFKHHEVWFKLKWREQVQENTS